MARKRTTDDPTAVEKLTDKGANKVGRALRKTRAGIQGVPGPSTNAATNLLVADIAFRGASILFRRTMEKGLLRARYEPVKAREIVEGRTLGRTVISAAVARVATRSVPGAMLVGGGILAKSIVDRTVNKRRSRRRGEKQLQKQSEN